MPKPFTQNAVEIFLRKTPKDDTWMLCGYASGLKEPDETVVFAAGRDLLDMSFLGQSKTPKPDHYAGIEHEPVADLVMRQIWQRIKPDVDVAVMQIYTRAVCWQSGLTMFAGILQDPAQVLGIDRGADPLFFSGSVDEEGFHLTQETRDLSFTRGHTLSQLHEEPIWRLGADEPWAALSTVRPDIAKKIEEGHEIRERILTGRERPHDATRLSGIAIETRRIIKRIGEDPSYDSFERNVAELGGFPKPSHAGLFTQSEKDAFKSFADKAVAARFSMDFG